MLLREIFEILHAEMAILVLFEHLSSKHCLNLLTLILSTSPNMVRFVTHFQLCVLKAKGILLSKRFEIMKNLYLSKTLVR